MPKMLKVTVVLLSFTLAYLTGYYLRYQQGHYPKVGYALICLGSLLYGSAIWLIAQIFHLEAEAGMGFLLWYLGVIPVAYLFNSSFNLSLALVNLVAWFLAGKYPLGPAFLIFPLLLGVTIFPLVLKKKDSLNFVAAIIALYIWFIPLGVKLAKVNFSVTLGVTSLLLLSLLLYALYHRLKESHKFFASDFTLSLALLGLYISLAAFSFNGFLEEFNRDLPLHSFPYLVGASLLSLLYLKYQEKKLSCLDLPFLLLYLLAFTFMPALAKENALLIANNLIFFLYTLLAIYYGYLIKRPFIFNLSMVMFAGAVAMKYFDFFFALLPRSAFFISGGLLLLLGSLLLEHKRRNLLKAMEGGSHHVS